MAAEDAAATIVIVKVRELFPTLLVALTVKLNVPAVGGVPEMTPVFTFSDNPPGSAPDGILHVIGVEPVAARAAL